MDGKTQIYLQCDLVCTERALKIPKTLQSLHCLLNSKSASVPLSSPSCLYSKRTQRLQYVYLFILSMHFSLPKMHCMETVPPESPSEELSHSTCPRCNNAIGQGGLFMYMENQGSESLGLPQGDRTHASFHSKYCNKHLLPARCVLTMDSGI